MKKYDQLTRKEKQLIALEYPYKADNQLWDTTLGKSDYNTSKFFSSPEEIIEIKEEMAKEDVSLINRRNFVTGEKTTTHSETISILDSVMGPFGDEVYRNALELSERELSPKNAIKELYIIQAQRLKMGMEYEAEVGLGNNPETEACVRGLESIIKTYNDIVNGQKHEISVNHSVSSMIAEMNLDEEDFIDLEDDMYDSTED